MAPWGRLVIPAPTTEIGRRALQHANSPRERAKQYFAGLMGSELLSEMSHAALVVRALEGQPVALPALQWLKACEKSFDDERSRMATLALSVILEDA